MTKHYDLYILKLEQDKYYVGITAMRDPYKRIEQHQRGYFSSQWTKKYRPIQTLEVRDLGEVTQVEAEHTETLVTQEYMNRFGHNNVRGGGFNYSGKYMNLGWWLIDDAHWKEILEVLFLILALALALLKILALEGRVHF